MYFRIRPVSLQTTISCVTLLFLKSRTFGSTANKLQTMNLICSSKWYETIDPIGQVGDKCAGYLLRVYSHRMPAAASRVMQCKSMMTLENRPLSAIFKRQHRLLHDSWHCRWRLVCLPLNTSCPFLPLFLLQTFCKPSAVQNSESSFVHNFEVTVTGQGNVHTSEARFFQNESNSKTNSGQYWTSKVFDFGIHCHCLMSFELFFRSIVASTKNYISEWKSYCHCQTKPSSAIKWTVPDSTYFGIKFYFPHQCPIWLNNGRCLCLWRFVLHNIHCYSRLCTKFCNVIEFYT